MFDRITSKWQNIEAFRYGHFGNTVEVWDTVEEFLDSEEPTATIRCKDSRGGGGFCKYCVPKEDIHSVMDSMALEGADRDLMWFHANPPADGQILQFEYQHRDSTGWIREPVMRYTFVNEPMRPALAKQCIHERGHIKCQALIHQHMTDPSWSMFLDCVNRYPDHVIEVSCFSTNIGVVPGHNSIIWEVRDF